MQPLFKKMIALNLALLSALITPGGVYAEDILNPQTNPAEKQTAAVPAGAVAPPSANSLLKPPITADSLKFLNPSSISAAEKAPVTDSTSAISTATTDAANNVTASSAAAVPPPLVSMGSSAPRQTDGPMDRARTITATVGLVDLVDYPFGTRYDYQMLGLIGDDGKKYLNSNQDFRSGPRDSVASILQQLKGKKVRAVVTPSDDTSLANGYSAQFHSITVIPQVETPTTPTKEKVPGTDSVLTQQPELYVACDVLRSGKTGNCIRISKESFTQTLKIAQERDKYASDPTRAQDSGGFTTEGMGSNIDPNATKNISEAGGYQFKSQIRSFGLPRYSQEADPRLYTIYASSLESPTPVVSPKPVEPPVFYKPPVAPNTSRQSVDQYYYVECKQYNSGRVDGCSPTNLEQVEEKIQASEKSAAELLAKWGAHGYGGWARSDKVNASLEAQWGSGPVKEVARHWSDALYPPDDDTHPTMVIFRTTKKASVTDSAPQPDPAAAKVEALKAEVTAAQADADKATAADTKAQEQKKSAEKILAANQLTAANTSKAAAAAAKTAVRAKNASTIAANASAKAANTSAIAKKTLSDALNAVAKVEKVVAAAKKPADKAAAIKLLNIKKSAAAKASKTAATAEQAAAKTSKTAAAAAQAAAKASKAAAAAEQAATKAAAIVAESKQKAFNAAKAAVTSVQARADAVKILEAKKAALLAATAPVLPKAPAVPAPIPQPAPPVNPETPTIKTARGMFKNYGSPTLSGHIPNQFDDPGLEFYVSIRIDLTNFPGTTVKALIGPDQNHPVQTVNLGSPDPNDQPDSYKGDFNKISYTQLQTGALKVWVQVIGANGSILTSQQLNGPFGMHFYGE